MSEARAGLTQVRNSWRAQAGDELATAQAELASRQEVMPALVAETATKASRGQLVAFGQLAFSFGVLTQIAVALIGTWVDYGALAVAAQRGTRALDALQARTPGDGIVCGTGLVGGRPVAAMQNPRRKPEMIRGNNFTFRAVQHWRNLC